MTVMQMVQKSSVEPEALQVLAVCICAEAASKPANVKHLGGMYKFVTTLQDLVDHAIAAGSRSGLGCKIQLLSVALRTLAQQTSWSDGKMAAVASKGSRSLLAVLHTEMQVRSVPKRVLRPSHLDSEYSAEPLFCSSLSQRFYASLPLPVS